jgi:putative hydroxymethylpyrimidine transport system permease protein
VPNAPSARAGWHVAHRLLRSGLVCAVILAAWQGAVVVLDLPPFILPSPRRVAAAFLAHSDFLMRNAAITALEIVLGLMTGTGLGVVTALAASGIPAAGRVVLPVMVASQALPVFAIAPLLVIWLGYGIASKVVMATLIIYFPIASAFLDGLRRTDPGLLELAVISDAGRLRTLALIRIPAALPGLASGLRVAAAVAPIGAVVGEWVGASAGLGFVMLQSNARMQTDMVFAALLMLGATAVLIRTAVEAATRRLVHWIDETSP